MPLKTLFLNPPSFENFDGGASSRWPATREIESYWYPVWLAYPAGMLEGSRLLDANPTTSPGPKSPRFSRTTSSWCSSPAPSAGPAISVPPKRSRPPTRTSRSPLSGRQSPPITDKALNECAAIDFVCRREFDFSVVEYANGKPLEEILGVSYRDESARTFHNPDRPQVEKLDKPDMPWVTDIYKRDLDVTKYNVPFLLHPYVALYSTRGCPAQCTFCLWPQTLSGHAWRKRSTDDVAAEMAHAKQLFPDVKEFFFDDDTFNINGPRTIELCEKLKPLGLTWSCTSRVTTSYETLKAMKEAGCRLLIVGYRVRRSADPQEHQEGRHCRARSRVHPRLPQAWTCRPWRLHSRPAWRDRSFDPQHDQLRQVARLRDDPGLDRSCFPRH